jgi:hypothetical protein
MTTRRCCRYVLKHLRSPLALDRATVTTTCRPPAPRCTQSSLPAESATSILAALDPRHVPRRAPSFSTPRDGGSVVSGPFGRHRPEHGGRRRGPAVRCALRRAAAARVPDRRPRSPRRGLPGGSRSSAASRRPSPRSRTCRQPSSSARCVRWKRNCERTGGLQPHPTRPRSRRSAHSGRRLGR